MSATTIERTADVIGDAATPSPGQGDGGTAEEHLSTWLRRQARSYSDLDSDRGRLVAVLLSALAADALACETPGRVLDVEAFLSRRACMVAERDMRPWPEPPDEECDGHRWVLTEWE